MPETGGEQSFRESAAREFFRAADSYLITEGHGQDHTVVVPERPRPGSKKRILIPDTCLALGVSYTDPFEVYRSLGLRFN